MADLLGNIKGGLVTVYKQAIMSEIPGNITMGAGIDIVKNKVLFSLDKNKGKFGKGRDASDEEKERSLFFGGKLSDVGKQDDDDDDNDDDKTSDMAAMLNFLAELLPTLTGTTKTTSSTFSEEYKQAEEYKNLDEIGKKRYDEYQKILQKDPEDEFSFEDFLKENYPKFDYSTATINTSKISDIDTSTQETSEGPKYSPFKQVATQTPVMNTEDLALEYNNAIRDANPMSLDLSYFEATKPVIKSLIDEAADDETKTDQVRANINLIKAATENEKVLRKEASEAEISPATFNSGSFLVSQYFNQSNERKLVFNPTNNNYEFVTKLPQGVFITQNQVREVINKGTVNHAFEAKYFNAVNTIVKNKNEAGATLNKDVNHFKGVARGMLKEDPSKMLHVLRAFKTVGSDKTFPEHLKEMLTMTNAEPSVVDDTIGALTIPEHPDFNLQKSTKEFENFLAQDLLQKHNNVTSRSGSSNQNNYKNANEVLEAFGINPETLT